MALHENFPRLQLPLVLLAGLGVLLAVFTAGCTPSGTGGGGTGPTPSGAPISEAAKDDIHHAFDFQLVTAMNGIVNGSNARPVVQGNERCAGWTLNPARPAPLP